MKYILFKDLPDLLSVGKTTCRRYYNAFVTECNRADTKIGGDYYIEASTRNKWVEVHAFIYFLKHKQQLDDEIGRKRVQNFELKEVAENVAII